MIMRMGCAHQPILDVLMEHIDSSQTPSKSLATLVSEHVFVKVKQMVLDISMPEVCQTA